jgi:hypothetical protein
VAGREQPVAIDVVVDDVGRQAHALRDQLELDGARVADVRRPQAFLPGGGAEADVGGGGTGGARERRLRGGADAHEEENDAGAGHGAEQDR